jgi:hypothetical protein
MQRSAFAAIALIVSSSLGAQTAAPAVDYATATPISGRWIYSFVADGSQATFVDASAQPQVTIHCTRATRRVTISKPAGVAAPSLYVWTSSLARTLPAIFNPIAARLTADVAAFDPLLDGIAFSRGRIAIAAPTTPALVVPAWAEAARVIEDCRG